MDLDQPGSFYLGREYDLAAGVRKEAPVFYDSRDLTTHAVCLGMTGSGKTGLCVSLLEEAALDGIPAILIDPKGDITNLALQFPDLDAASFAPWVNADDARRADMEVDAYAAQVAEQWRAGLAEWGQDAARVRRLKDSVETRIYTPGSDAGLSISVLASLKAPDGDFDEHAEDLREQIRATARALLGLLGLEADPLKSREHILLANLFEHYWRRGEDLDLGELILAIQKPPMEKLGVIDVETFFPEKERFTLAMQMNNILAAPSFQSWIQGDSLDVAGLLHGPDGRPRHSIFYIAHLSDAERMFFVTLLLEQVLQWMRRQSGTTSLRALLYMDEVYGFFPPVKNPPTKQPLMTLLKQGRAFGVGCVLATQNPVDLDYKGLSNAGTWFLGKLQTERDKLRVLEGLESVSGEAGHSLDRAQLDPLLGSLGSRKFLLHNVHGKRPVVFETRWAMSYLRGPLTRGQVKELPAAQEAEEAEGTAEPAAESQPRPQEVTRPQPAPRTTAPASARRRIPEVYLPVGRTAEDASARLVYQPSLLALAVVRFVDSRRAVKAVRRVGRHAGLQSLQRVVRWDQLTAVDCDVNSIPEAPEEEVRRDEVDESFLDSTRWKEWNKDFADHLYHEQRFPVFEHQAFRLYGTADEGEKEFHLRVQGAANEKRDAEVDRLRDKFEARVQRIEDRLARQQQELEEDEAKFEARRREELLTAGESFLGWLGLLGRRKSSVSKSATKRRLTKSAQLEVEQTRSEIERLHKDLEELQQHLREEVDAINERWNKVAAEVTVHEVKPRRADVKVELCALAWVPHWEMTGADGSARRVVAWGGGAG